MYVVNSFSYYFFAAFLGASFSLISLPSATAFLVSGESSTLAFAAFAIVLLFGIQIYKLLLNLPNLFYGRVVVVVVEVVVVLVVVVEVVVVVY